MAHPHPKHRTGHLYLSQAGQPDCINRSPSSPSDDLTAKVDEDRVSMVEQRAQSIGRRGRLSKADLHENLIRFIINPCPKGWSAILCILSRLVAIGLHVPSGIRIITPMGVKASFPRLSWGELWVPQSFSFSSSPHTSAEFSLFTCP